MTVSLAPAGTADRVMARLFPQPVPYANDPVGFSRDILRFDPWSKQRQILESVRDHRRTAVRSGHGVGKTAIAARAALAFYATRPGKTRVITTGASWTGVETLLWAELHAAYEIAAGAIPGKLNDTDLKASKEWFILGLSTDKPERFAGQHADHLLLIIDEASGIDERIYEAASGYLSGPDAHLLLIGNPTQLAGEFYAAFHEKSDKYNTISISAFDTPAFTGEQVSDAAWESLKGIPDYVEEMRDLYGEGSPVYQVRVLGEFASTSDDTVCSGADVEDARARTVERHVPAVVSCDVARFGSDETVISVRRGNHVRVVRRYAGQDTMRTVGEILQVADAVVRGTETPLSGPVEPAATFPPNMLRIVVDDTGVGGGVTDRLREVIWERSPHAASYQVVPFTASAASWSGDYPNRRSELWFSFSERLPQLDLDPDKKLAAELVAPKYSLDSKGRRVVEPKADTKKRLTRSPDTADSVLLTFAVPDVVLLPSIGNGTASPPITAGLMERAW